MSIELWTAFVVASAALLAIPGPVVFFLLGHALGRGRSVAWMAVPGVALGGFVAMTVSLLGAGALLAASATLFTVMKLCGAAYLVWLGVALLRSTPLTLPVSATAHREGGSRSVFVQALVVTALNPKDIVFFVAFLPQFVDPARPVLSQLVIIEATFLTMVTISTCLWIVLGSGMRRHLRGEGALRWVNRVGGGCLIGAGALTAAVRSST